MRTLVIGAGPAGLEAATAADRAGRSVFVAESGRVAAGVRSWSAARGWSTWDAWAGPAGRAILGDPPSGTPTGRELVSEWLVPLAERLDVAEHTRVFGVAPAAEALRVGLETADGERRFEVFDQVIDAAGAGPWAPAGPDGLALPAENRAASAGRLRYGPVDPDDLPPGDVLVLGEGPEARAVLACLAEARPVHHAGAPAWREALAGLPITWHPPITGFARSAEGLGVQTASGRFHVAQAVACTGRRLDLGWIRALPWSYAAGRLSVYHPAYHLIGARR